MTSPHSNVAILRLQLESQLVGEEDMIPVCSYPPLDAVYSTFGVLLGGLGGQVLKVYCEISPRHASTVILRHGAKKDFNLSWDKYVKGHIYSNYNYWAGLDTIHALTKAGYNTLTFEVVYNYPTFTSQSILYKDFHVGDSSTDYTLTVGQPNQGKGGVFFDDYGAVLGDCLSPANGARFSTKDADHDLEPENCAALAGSGWWFKDCNFVCNPFGRLPGSGSETLSLPGLNFTHSDYVDRFASVQMYFYDSV
ncbi:ryncolin-4-like [Aplysia californica]|uniref:Ryncolin-4-like n=1 Tax=Aplysia californica TaxID=6500 RepID=A0ABM0JYE2_APLCA|nr:ryncolin-4-like [Aplysia californica]